MNDHSLEAIIDVLENSSCQSCGEKIWNQHNYCPHCGAKNTNFDPALFETENGMTIEEQLDGCRETHPSSHEELLANAWIDKDMIGERSPDYLFCYDCGRRLVPQT